MFLGKSWAIIDRYLTFGLCLLVNRPVSRQCAICSRISASSDDRMAP